MRRGLGLVQQASLVLVSRFQPQPFLDVLAKYRVTIGYLVPPIALFLAKHASVDAVDLSALRWIVSSITTLLTLSRAVA